MGYNKLKDKRHPDQRRGSQIDKLIDTVLYGDIHEEPLWILKDKCPGDKKLKLMDDEQMLRLHIAATIKRMALDGQL